MRIHSGWAVAVAVGLGLFTAATASASDLSCDRLVNGSTVTHVYSYPAVIVVDTAIFNDSDDRSFTVTSIWDYPRESAPTVVAINVGPGSSIGGTSAFTLDSHAECAELAGRERAKDGQPIRLKTFAEVLTATGEKTRCVARVVCH